MDKYNDCKYCCCSDCIKDCKNCCNCGGEGWGYCRDYEPEEESDGQA